MNVLLWILQTVLAVHTLIGAAWNLGHSERIVPALAATSHLLWVSPSGFEIVCAIGLLLPAMAKS